MTKRSRNHLRQTRRGAVLIEATMAACALVLTAAGLLFVHGYAEKLIRAAEQAREAAWSRALNECDQGEPLLKDLAQDVINGDLPVPDGLIPKALDVEVSMTVQGLLDHKSRTVSQTMTFICNPKPSHADPLAKPNEWVLGLFM
jgi:hypothetical protein